MFRFTQGEERPGPAPENDRDRSTSDRAVVGTGWRPGFLVVETVEHLRSRFGYGLAETKRAADRIVAGDTVRLPVPRDMPMHEALTRLKELSLDAHAGPSGEVFKVARLQRNGWVCRKESTDERAAATSRKFATKREAVDRARRAARAASPSALVIERKDGSLQRVVQYAHR
ncbi:MAG: DUF2188 domain-containing protein [Alphaproteobacteria bacterium]|nr:DUF2188 domain-containing protein [Alphaproteobacteria bacterium]